MLASLSIGVILRRRSTRAACKLVVGALALAHDRACEAELAVAIDRALDAGATPDLASLRADFEAGDDTEVPNVVVTLAAPAVYDELTCAGFEVMA